MSTKISTSIFRDLPKSRVSRQFARLNKIAGSPKTAYKFSPKVSEVIVVIPHCSSMLPSQRGLKRFWNNYLPTLSFHNPQVNFIVKQITKDADSEKKIKLPAKIVVREKDQNLKAAPSVDCLDKTEEQILTEFIKVNNLLPVPSEEIPHFYL